MPDRRVPHVRFRTLDSADLKGKRVLVRVDLNVPMENGKVTDTTRIDRILPTMNEISDKGGKVIMLAHFGRPEGRARCRYFAEARRRSRWPALLGKPVGFADDCVGDRPPTAVAK